MSRRRGDRDQKLSDQVRGFFRIILKADLFDARSAGRLRNLCWRAGADGRGHYIAEGFAVLEGSRGPAELMSSGVGSTAERQRERLLLESRMVVEGAEIRFLKDTMFNSPSSAAATLTGSSSNGWIDWTTEDGRTLDSVERVAD